MNMKPMLAPLCGLALWTSGVGAADTTQTKPGPTKSAQAKPAGSTTGRKPASDRADDEQALRKSAADFAKAFNERDAKAIADQFSAEAEMVDLDGNVVQGREAIEKSFAAQFEHPLFQMAVEIESLRFVGDNLAIEDGHLILTSEDDDLKLRSPYTAVHVREDDQWRVATRVNNHTRSWRAVDRVLGGEPLDDIEEITVVRAASNPNPTKKTD